MGHFGTRSLNWPRRKAASLLTKGVRELSPEILVEVL